METLDFLNAIMPEHGLRFIVTSTNLSGRPVFQHLSFRDNATAAEAARRLDDAGATVYFAPASFKSGASRKGENVLAVRSYWLDIDCGYGKPYQTQGAGQRAVLEFAKALGLPTPFIVSSGRGLHVYWPVTADLEPDEWLASARLIKAACKKYGLKADHSRTADIASLLRPVGTHHRKGEPILVGFL